MIILSLSMAADTSHRDGAEPVGLTPILFQPCARPLNAILLEFLEAHCPIPVKMAHQVVACCQEAAHRAEPQSTPCG